jgi:mono/diheme cytochrome c family protein
MPPIGPCIGVSDGRVAALHPKIAAASPRWVRHAVLPATGRFPSNPPGRRLLKNGAKVGEEAMRLFATWLEVSTVFLLLAMSPLVSSAQPTSGDQALDDSQLLGMRLFNQSCRVCHTKPQMVSPLYGPELSRSSLGGQETVMREVISNGTPRMPGFKYHFEPAQIDAIVAYLKTIPTPPAPAPAAPAR